MPELSGFQIHENMFVYPICMNACDKSTMQTILYQ